MDPWMQAGTCGPAAVARPPQNVAPAQVPSRHWRRNYSLLFPTRLHGQVQPPQQPAATRFVFRTLLQLQILRTLAKILPASLLQNVQVLRSQRNGLLDAPSVVRRHNTCQPSHPAGVTQRCPAAPETAHHSCHHPVCGRSVSCSTARSATPHSATVRLGSSSTPRRLSA
jgi:hypothetical protein